MRAGALLLVVACAALPARANRALDEARRALDRGDYAQVERLARGAQPREQAELTVARALARTGRIAEAEKHLAALAPRSPAARIELAEILLRTGRRAEAKAIWNRFFDDYEQGRIDKKRAEPLTQVAIAARRLGSWQDASDLFREATEADPRYLPAHLLWGETFLDKYAAGEAERDARAALALDGHSPEAHLLMARVKLEQGYDVPAANRELDSALLANPHLTGALDLRAELAVDVEDWAEAEKLTGAALAVDATDPQAHALRAAVAFLRGDQGGFEREKQAVLAIDPRASSFFHTVAEAAVKQHRYQEANGLEEQALKLDPDDASALAAIGQNELRLGEEDKGLGALRRAFELDGYNVRVFNLLNLYEQVIPQAYTWVDAPPFRVRVPADEKAVLERVLPPLVAAEWRELTARYRFTPRGPLTIELYADPRHYAVRTVGLPGLEALGVTFGKVVTGRSPGEGRFNWGMMVWHEIGHVFSIQRSRARVPRWFTEGLAEWETEHHRPEWRRHTQAELATALERNRLLSVAALNSGFVRARSVDEIVVAYHEAAEAVAFLIRRFGFDAAVRALELYGEGKETPEVVKAVSGLDVDAFDAAFRAELKSRLARYLGRFAVHASETADLEGAAELARVHPDDARAHALLALALLARREAAEADAHARRAREIDPLSREGLYAAARVLMAAQSWDGAELLLRKLIDLGGDGYDVRMALAECERGRGHRDEAQRDLERARELDPERAEPRVILAKQYLDQGREEAATAELEAAARLDVHDRALALSLVEKQSQRGRWKELQADAELAGFVVPLDPAVHLAAARAAIGLGDARRAERELELARLCKGDAAEIAQLAARVRAIK
jgi:tetratricopeptide (TPR) repeat protein